MSAPSPRLGRIVLVVLAASVNTTLGQQANVILLNGSFEEGQEAPSNWTSQTGASWETGTAHRGKWFVRVADATERGWQSDSVTISTGTDCRLEGWLRAENGDARLGVGLLDDNGRVVRSVVAPSAQHVAEWRYVAVEFKADAGQARIWLAGQDADFDDIALAPVAISYLGNRALKSDAKGRIGLWDEEKEGAIAPGQRAGSHRSDPTVQRRELASLLVESTAAWYAVSSVNYNLPAFTDKIELSGWASTDADAAAQILACWMDDTQKVVRVDAGPEARGNEWQHLKFTLDSPP